MRHRTPALKPCDRDDCPIGSQAVARSTWRCDTPFWRFRAMRPSHTASPFTAVLPMLVLAAFAVIVPSASHAQSESFDWRGNVAQGATLRVFTFAGTVTVRAASGSEARIRGTSRNTGEGAIRYDSSRAGGDVRVCALYGDAECTESGIRREGRSSRNGRAAADFVVEVPRGVHVRVASGSGEVTVDGVTGNVHAASGSGTVRVGSGAGEVRASSGSGSVTVDGALGPVQASTGSGPVRITTGRGPVTASTGSGSIEVSMAALTGTDDMSFSSGSGSISLRLPSDFAANIHATTGSGDFESDFPMTISGRMSRHSVRATIGGGGRNVRMSTGSGDIRILRQGDQR